MSRSLVRYLCFVLALLSPLPVAAEIATETVDVESIFTLERVRDVRLDETHGSVLVTMQRRVMRFSTFPLRVTANINLNSDQRIADTDIRISELNIDGITAINGPDDLLFVLGEGSAPGSGLRAGLMLSVAGAETLKDPPAIPSVAPLASTPFTSAFFSPSGRFFAVSPTWYSVVSISQRALLGYLFGDLAKLELDDIFLRCGSPNEFSILTYQDRQYYLATMADEPVIEIGQIELNNPEAQNAACLSPVSTRALKTRNRSALTHSLITRETRDRSDREVDTSLLVFDPAQSQVIHFPIVDIKGRLIVLTSEGEPYILLPRLRDKSVGETNTGIMAADNSGEVVLLAYLGTKTVHRLSYSRVGFQYLGGWQFKSPVRGLTVAEDGDMVAIWTGDASFNGRDSLTIVRNPRAVGAFDPLPSPRYTVAELQSALNAAGVSVGVDGKFGPQTQAALDTYVKILEQAGTDPDQYPVADPRLQQNLEGLFPLGAMQFRN